MFAAGGGGQSWLVGNASVSADVPGVHGPPSFGPPWHVPPVQIGQGWMPGTSGTRSPVK